MKNLFILLLFFILIFSLQAQNQENILLLDTIYNYDLTYANTWEFSSRTIIMERDENNQVTQELNQRREVDEWVNASLNTNTYYGENQIKTELIQTWSEEEQLWQDTSRFTKYNELGNETYYFSENRFLYDKKVTTYDESGKNAIRVDYYEWEDQLEWKLEEFDVVSYDNLDNRTEFIHSEWSEDRQTFDYIYKVNFSYEKDSLPTQELVNYYSVEEQNWYPTGRHTTTYDSNGLPQTQLDYYWDSTIEDWIRDYKVAYEFNENNQLFSSYDYRWSMDDETWVALDKSETTYNEFGNEMTFMVHDFIEGEWILTYSSEYEYDENQNLIKEASKDFSTYNTDVRDYVTTYSYDEEDNLTQKRYLTWLNNELESGYLVYYIYSNLLSDVFQVVETTLQVYPNPTTDRIVIDTQDYQALGNAMIYTANGQLIKTVSLNHQNEIDVTDLERGLYILSFRRDQRRMIGSFMKL